MEKLIIQITSGRGPIECCRVVARVQELIIKQGRRMNISIEVLDSSKADLEGTLLSATLLAKGQDLHPLINDWQGTVQWIAQSPYRKFHKRKNWFVGVAIFDADKPLQWDLKDVVFETCRSSGPGGQNVNKVETAVRGIHLPSGIRVLASDSRSQWQNKKLCLERLQVKVLAWQTTQLAEKVLQQWEQHNQLQRGNPVKIIEEKL